MTLVLNGTTGVSAVDGSASTPAIQGNDSNTGMFFPAADTIAFAEGGAEVMRIDSSGNVGIGTSSPSNLLHVSQASSDFQVRVTGTSAANLGAVRAYNAGGEASVFGTTGASNSGYGANLGVLGTVTNIPQVFVTNNTERARIDSSGNFSITQTPGKYTVDVTGGSTSIANGGTVDFPNASGMLVVNNYSNGNVTIYLCGGGVTAAIGSVGGQVGTLSYVGGIAGYRWTNNYGSTATFGFFFVRTRPTA